MSSPDLSWQQRAFELVRAAVPGSVAVETQPAVDQAFPYVHLGECTISDHEIGHELELTVHVWSNASGTDECKALQHNVRLALHSQSGLSKNEWTFTCCREDYATVILDRNGEIWHGLQRFRVLASTF
jgi:hypothetical protein